MKRFLISLGLGVFCTLSAGSAGARGVMTGIGELQYLLSDGVAQGIFAKESCSCIFVSGLSLEDCIEKSNVPRALLALLNISIDMNAKKVSVNALVFPYFTPARAEFNKSQPRKGCRLTESAKDSRL
jgi:hypothetical protein